MKQPTTADRFGHIQLHGLPGTSLTALSLLIQTASLMGRSAKIVRTSAFEKQKRHEKGQEWRKSQWKQARESEKTSKAQGKAEEKADAMETDDQHQKELSGKVEEAMKFFNLADLAAGAGPTLDEAKSTPVKTPKAKGKAKKKS